MGFLSTIGRIGKNYNDTNDTLTAGEAILGGADRATDFLGNWMNTKLPELVTGLAIRVVDDGSASIAKEVLDAGKGEGFLGGFIPRN